MQPQVWIETEQDDVVSFKLPARRARALRDVSNKMPGTKPSKAKVKAVKTATLRRSRSEPLPCIEEEACSSPSTASPCTSTATPSPGLQRAMTEPFKDGASPVAPPVPTRKAAKVCGTYFLVSFAADGATALDVRSGSSLSLPSTIDGDWLSDLEQATSPAPVDAAVVPALVVVAPPSPPLTKVEESPMAVEEAAPSLVVEAALPTAAETTEETATASPVVEAPSPAVETTAVVEEETVQPPTVEAALPAVAETTDVATASPVVEAPSPAVEMTPAVEEAVAPSSAMEATAAAEETAAPSPFVPSSTTEVAPAVEEAAASSPTQEAAPVKAAPVEAAPVEESPTAEPAAPTLPALASSIHDLKYTEAEVDVMKRQAIAGAKAELEAEFDAKLKDMLDVEQSRLAALWRKDLEDAFKEAEEFKAGMEIATKRRDEFAELLAVLEEDHHTLEATHATTTAALDDTKMGLACAETKIGALNAEKADLQTRLLTCMESREALETQYNAERAAHEATKGEVASLTKQLTSTTADADAAKQAAQAASLLRERTIEAYKAKMEEKKVAFLKLKEEHRVATEQVAVTSTQLKGAQTELATALSTHTRQLSSAEARANECAAAARTLQAQLDAKTTEAATATSRVATLTKDLEATTAKAAQVETSLKAAAVAATSEHSATVSTLEGELRELKIKVYDLSAENRTLTQTKGELLGYVATLQDQLGLDD